MGKGYVVRTIRVSWWMWGLLGSSNSKESNYHRSKYLKYPKYLGKNKTTPIIKAQDSHPKSFGIQKTSQLPFVSIHQLLNGGFLEWWYPQIIHFNRCFFLINHPFWGTPADWKPPVRPFPWPEKLVGSPRFPIGLWNNPQHDFSSTIPERIKQQNFRSP